MDINLSFIWTVVAVFLGIALWQAFAFIWKSAAKAINHGRMARAAKAEHEKRMREDPRYREFSAKFDAHMKQRPEGVPEPIWAMGFNPEMDDEDEHKCDGCSACGDKDNVVQFHKKDAEDTTEEPAETKDEDATT